MPAAVKSAQIDLASADRFACGQCGGLYREGYERCPRDGSELVAGALDPLIGRTLSGRYRVEDVIGEGGMGRVYRAAHVCDQISRPVAIKTLFGDLAAAPRNRLRFSNEARAASRLQHPNVVPVIDYSSARDEPMYLAMELVEGETVEDRLERGPLPVADAIDIALQLARGLAHAHERGVVHRDLKPSNVGLAPNNGLLVARIFDFGLALLEDQTGENARLTTTGMVHGTPLYLSPEQARGVTADHRSDLYALGVILYEMVTGQPPFHSGAVYDILVQHLTHRPPSLSARCGRPMSAGLEAVVGRLLEKRPERRYQSADEVAEVLASLAGDLERAEALAPTIDGSMPVPTAVAADPDRPVETGRRTGEILWRRADGGRFLSGRWPAGIAATAAGLALGLAISSGTTTLPLEVGAVSAAPQPWPSIARAAAAVGLENPTVKDRQPESAPDRQGGAGAAGSSAAAVERAPKGNPGESVRRPSRPSMRALSSQYARTGAAIERLLRVDPEGSDELRRRYLQAGYARAVREAPHRTEVMRRLRTLETHASRRHRVARAPRL